MGHTLEQILPVAAAIAATVAFPGNAIWAAPLAAGATSGAENYSQSHNVGSALKSGAGTAAGSFAGGQIGGALGDTLGGAAGSTGGTAATGASTGINAGSSLGNFLNNSVGTNLGITSGVGQSVAGNTLGNALGDFAPGLGSALASTGTGSALGSLVGGQIGGNLATPALKHGPWQPTQQPGQALPPDVSNLSGLNPLQQATNLASTGVFGGGLGPDEQRYFTNLVNRQLTNPDRSTNPMSTLAPVENTYLQRLGLGNYTNPTNLLQALSGFQPA